MSKRSNSTQPFPANDHNGRIYALAQKHWLSGPSNTKAADKSHKKSSAVVSEIFKELAAEHCEKGVVNVVTASTLLYQKAAALNSLQYLEKYLWETFSGDSKDDHVVSIALLVIAKNQDQGRPWEFFQNDDKFSVFFNRVLSILSTSSTELWIKSQLIYFLTIAAGNLDIGAIRKETSLLVSILIWSRLSSESLRNHLVAKDPSLKKLWKHYQKRLTNAQNEKDQSAYTKLLFSSEWLFSVTMSVLDIVYSLDSDKLKPAKLTTSVELQYITRFLEFVITLVSQLPTKRFTNDLFLDIHLVPVLQHSDLYTAFPSKDFVLPQLIDLLDYYLHFPVDSLSGTELSEDQVQELHMRELKTLRQAAFEKFPTEAQFLAHSTLGSLGSESVLSEHLSGLDLSKLQQLCEYLNIRTTYPIESVPLASRELLTKCILYKYQTRPTVQETSASLDSMPTEQSLFSNTIKLTEDYSLKSHAFPLPLPKMALQYLSMLDFFMRAFQLERYASFSDIKSDMEIIAERLKPQVVAGVGKDGEYNLTDRQLKLHGSSKMAARISYPVSVLEVAPPKVGAYIFNIQGSAEAPSSDKDATSDFRGISQINSDADMVVPPGSVKAEIAFELEGHNTLPSVVQEWDSLMPGDVVFLAELTTPSPNSKHAWEKSGIRRLRSAEVIKVMDEKDRPINIKRNQDFEYEDEDDDDDEEEEEEEVNGQGNYKKRNQRKRRRTRKLHLYLDAIQYSKDNNEIYQNLNVIIRRKPQENNFYPILKNLKAMILEKNAVPDWLTDVFLGFGSAGAASYDELHKRLESGDGFCKENNLTFPSYIDYKDTFLDSEHLFASFPKYNVEIIPEESLDRDGIVCEEKDTTAAKKRKATQDSGPPYVLPGYIENGGQKGAAESSEDPAPATLNAVSYSDFDIRTRGMGGFDGQSAKANRIRFTPHQVQALVKAMGPGLNVVVGPPGTGKTDVAVQMISNLYHNFPHQTTLVVAHSNQALNHIFEKIVGLDVDDRYLLRLGGGEEQLSERVMQRNVGYNDDNNGQSAVSFSQYGRVDRLLELRRPLLEQVDKLAQSMGVSGVYGDSCETGLSFYRIYVEPRWAAFKRNAARLSKDKLESLVEEFPFASHFSKNGLDSEAGKAYIWTQLDSGLSSRSWEGVLGFLKQLYAEKIEKEIFSALKEIRPFELVRSSREKARLMLVRQARVVAMTATYAGIHRRELIEAGFHYDNLVVEESAQLTELESVVLLALANAEHGERIETSNNEKKQEDSYDGDSEDKSMIGNKVEDDQDSRDVDKCGGGQDKIKRYFNAAVDKESSPKAGFWDEMIGKPAESSRRVILIGDDRQNAPIVRNIALRGYSRLDQSLFSRLVRLNVPTTMLDMQGRARPELVELYGWQYQTDDGTLRHLPEITENAFYRSTTPNAGFLRVCQFINVGEYKGRGETEPSRHMIQNLGEAEYAVALYQYMRLLGYPRESITILCAYYGQKKLIEEIVSKRCGRRNQATNKDPTSIENIFGYPGGGVKTVDEYQGEQNDYIILSMVRTKTVGYLRDRRRLTVATSRARKGLYVLGYGALMEKFAEEEPIMRRLLDQSGGKEQGEYRLGIVTGEMYSTVEQSVLNGEYGDAGTDGDKKSSKKQKKSKNKEKSGAGEAGRAKYVIESVEHLGQYVYEMAKTRQEYMKK